MNRESGSDIAIIGMAGRFPQASDLNRFWQNLRDGVESITFFTDDQLRAAGVSPDLLHNPHYVKAKGVLEDIDLFDASFFGFSDRDAELTDPQIRIFLECAWEALELAGCNPESFKGLIGVYTGMAPSTYRWRVVGGNPWDDDSADLFRASNAAQNLSTWVSYKLDLRGPSVDVHSACSTSLSAVHLACRALITFECDAALAGAVTVLVPEHHGHLYEEGGISSSDGHCRAFDAKADGLVGGHGAGVVVLKRLEDALASGDQICAVVKGSAVNNDGRRKLGYTAPAIDGQAQVIQMALAAAGIDPQEVGYVEAHGSGTSLGDLVEIAALNQAYGRARTKRASIALGSVKTNIGHLGHTAGIAGLIKTVLAIQHAEIPPSLNFQSNNPTIPFDRGPFEVARSLSPWSNKDKRIAGVSSFGLGGTNVHLIVEQAPEREQTQAADPWQLITVSAQSTTALERATDQLVEYLSRNALQNFADIAFTLHLGRKSFPCRRVAVCRDAAAAKEALQARRPSHVFTRVVPERRRPVAFLFPGLGDHYLDMGRGIYETEPVFAKEVDFCSESLRPLVCLDLREVMYPTPCVRQQDSVEADDKERLSLVGMMRASSAETSVDSRLHQTLWAHLSLFVIEYSLAKLWMSWGIVPDVMLGYSIGEYVAACLSDVISLEDSLRLLTERAQRISDLPAGAMLAVAASEAEVRPLLPPEITIAGNNGPGLCVVAGPRDAVEALEQSLARERRFVSRRLQTLHAFHSPMMEPVAPALIRMASGLRLRPPQIPYISNVTGTWLTPAQALDTAYWSQHLCRPVCFAQCLEELCRGTVPALVEVGPGQMLGSLAEQHLARLRISDRVIVSSLPASFDRQSDRACLLNALGRLWLGGIEPEWTAVHARERRHRVSLPTYPYERKRHWLARPLLSIQTPTAYPASTDASAPPSDQIPSPAELPNSPLMPAEAEHSWRSEAGASYCPPESVIEQRIVEIWENMFSVRPIGIHDSFFSLGGNSLTAIRVATELRDAFQIELPLKAVLSATTVSALALFIEDALLTSVEQMDETELSPLETEQ
jgi:acyl transferase domain-containing protein